MSKVLLGVGGILGFIGVGILRWSTPSPQAFVAPSIGLLLTVAGLTIVGVVLVSTYRPK